MKALGKLNLRSALLKSDEAFEETRAALKDGLTRAFDKAVQAALVDALDRLRDMDADTFTQQHAAHLMAGLQAQAGGEALQAALRGPVLDLSDVLFRMGIGEVAKGAGVDIAFGRPDRDALAVLQRGNLYWVGNHWNAHSHQKFDRILTEYLAQGLNRQQLVQRIADDFATLTSRSEIYWEVLADHVATKTRELGRVTGYERAGVEYVQVRAHLDARTSAICRAMHGRIIATKTLAAQKDDYLDAIRRGDMAAAKESWPMHGDAGELDRLPTARLPRGTASPPYHHRCRTITVMYVAPASDVARWRDKVHNREPLTKAETAALIDRAKTATWHGAERMKDHYDKHGVAGGWGSLDAYNAAAVDLIRRANRDVYLSIRLGRLHAVFAEPYRSRKGGTRYRIAVVDVTRNTIVSLHKRQKLDNDRDDVAPQKQPGRGIMKWLLR